MDWELQHTHQNQTDVDEWNSMQELRSISLVIPRPPPHEFLEIRESPFQSDKTEESQADHASHLRVSRNSNSMRMRILLKTRGGAGLHVIHLYTMAFVGFALLLLSVFICGNLSQVHAFKDNAARNAPLSHAHQQKTAPLVAQNISLDLDNVLHTVDPEFLSFTIPAYQIQDNFDLINFSLPRVQNMARGLNPAMLRVGGTSGDELIFVNGFQRGEGSVWVVLCT